MGIIEYDELSEDSLEFIKKQFDFLVNQYKNSPTFPTIKNSYVNPLEFDERDEIIMEKDSEIEILNSHRQVLDQVTVDLDVKNQLIKEYEHKLLQFNQK